MVLVRFQALRRRSRSRYSAPERGVRSSGSHQGGAALQGKNRYSRYPACVVALASMKSFTGTSPLAAMPAAVLAVPLT